MRLLNRTRAAGTLALATIILVAAGARLRAQEQPAFRLWAAQTGPDQVTLAWAEVPGAIEYRIHIGDPATAASPATRRPISVLGGASRGAVLPLRRVTAGLFLVAVGSDGRPILKVPFNEVSPVHGIRPVDAPASATATATGPEEVTLSWDPVPGATGYAIGRAVQPNGFRMLCSLCSSEPTYVDRDVTPGAPHAYTVAAIYSGGVSARTRSNTVTPGAVAYTPPGQPATTPTQPPAGQPATTPTYTPPGQPAGSATTSSPPQVNPQISATVPDTTPPPIGAPPSGASSLVTPPADTGSCKVVTAPPPASADTLERIDPRTGRIESRTTGSNPDANTAVSMTTVTTTTNLGSADYQKGKCLNRFAPGYPDLWDPVASASGMTSTEVIAAWKEIGVVALEYKHIFGRQPTPEETRRDVAALKAGTTWKQLWRQLAHSAERDTRFGYWAAAPIPDSLQAQRDFGLAVPPWAPNQCYGALGPRCEGGIPDMANGRVAPAWFGAFRMPDYTELAYVEIGVAVGSVLHDNECLRDKGGLNCNGLGAGDLVKIGGLWAAELEWNKAAWNVLDQRTWRETFGPYPTDPRSRDREWYDDLRPATPRPTMMAPAISMFTWPGLTVKYTGGETRQTRALQAPPGTSLDATDVAFCRSGVFASTGSFIGKAPWGICADGVAVTTPHTATPTPGTPTPGTPTPPASCKLDYQRADNMWAAAGRPDGLLGVESITLKAGENKVFITDWKYEKQRNDGVTYYGSHLRVATNSSSRPIRLQVVTAAGMVMSTVRLDPNTRKEFRDDLNAVYCEP